MSDENVVLGAWHNMQSKLESSNKQEHLLYLCNGHPHRHACIYANHTSLIRHKAGPTLCQGRCTLGLA